MGGLAAKKERRRMSAAIFLVLVFIGSLRKISDFDYWTHLSVGRYYITNYKAVLTNPSELFSNAEWLFQFFIYPIFMIGSDEGVSFAVALLSSLVFLPLISYVYRYKETYKIAYGYFYLGLIFYLISFRFVPRPEIIAYAIASFVLFMSLRWADQPNLKTFCFILSGFALWVPLHPSWHIGSILISFLILLFTDKRVWIRLFEGKTGKIVLLFSAMIILASLYYSIKFAVFVFENLMNQGMLAQITEMRPVWEFPDIALFYLVVVVISVLFCFMGERKRLTRLLFILVTTFLGSIVVRNVALAVIFMAPLALQSLSENRPNVWLMRKSRLLAGAVLLSIALLTVAKVNDDNPPWGMGVEWEWFPRDAAAYVKERGLPSEVFNNWDCGGYLVWAWENGPAVFMDGRLGVKAKVEDYDQILLGQSVAPLFEKYSINTVLTQSIYVNDGRIFPLVQRLMFDPEWKLIRATDALVFVRKAQIGQAPELPTAEAWKLVLRQAENLAKHDPDAEHLEFTRATAYFNLGDRNRALQSFKAGAGKFPAVAQQYTSLSWILSR